MEKEYKVNIIFTFILQGLVEVLKMEEKQRKRIDYAWQARGDRFESGILHKNRITLL
jgi:hypothetical protein